MCLDHLHDVVEAYAEPLHVVAVARRDAVEVLEDVAAVLFRDAYAVVGDADAYIFAFDGG